MSEPECQTGGELENLWLRNDITAVAPVGVSESELSAPVAETLHCTNTHPSQTNPGVYVSTWTGPGCIDGQPL